MSNGDLIKQAARLLRERATAATAGPWVARGYGDYGPGVLFEGGTDAWGNTGVECADTEDGWATTRYLPLVAPEVGLALADWLDEVGVRRDWAAAAKVARAILAAEATSQADA